MLRRVIYTTNSIEAASYQLRKVSKNRGHFPSDEAVARAAVAGDLRHPWTNEPENATRRKNCHQPSAKPRASSSKDRSPPTGTRPWPSSPPHTPTESTPTCKTLTQKTGQAHVARHQLADSILVGPPLHRGLGALEPCGDLGDWNCLVDNQLCDLQTGTRV